VRRIELLDARGHVWRVEVPETARERTRGLLGRDGLAPRTGMLFERARSVHTFGMRFPIAVSFLDGRLQVLAVRRVPPRRIVARLRSVRHVLECPYETDLRVGDGFRVLGD
jgi:hypothetical protein